MNRIKKLIIFIFVLSIISAASLFSASAAAQAYGAGTVSVKSLNIRTEPSTTSPIAATITKGETVVLLDSPSGNWYHISCRGTVGFVAAQYISDVQTAKNFSTSGILSGSDIRMRSTPSTSGKVLGTYADGTAMNVIGINNGWYKVVFEGKTGYIRSDLIRLGTSTMTALAPVNDNLGKKIADYAQQFIGLSYVYGAASPKVGFDCSGLTSYVYRQFGYTISRTASQQYRHNGISVSKTELQPGDLVFFSSNGGKSVTHVGLYYGDGKFVNASTGKVGVILSSLSSAYYERVYFGAKRIVS